MDGMAKRETRSRPKTSLDTLDDARQGCVAHNDGGSDEACGLRPLQAAARTYRIALGPCAAQKVLALQGAMPMEPDCKQTMSADSNGFSLHVTVRCAADDRNKLEHRCREITWVWCPGRAALSAGP